MSSDERHNPVEPGRSRGDRSDLPHYVLRRAGKAARSGIGDNRVLLLAYPQDSRDERRIDPHDVDVSSFSWFDFSKNLQPGLITTSMIVLFFSVSAVREGGRQPECTAQ